MYELVFWKYEEDVYLNNHEVYEAILDEKEVLGLVILPVEVILNRISNLFQTWIKVDENSWQHSNSKGAFQIKTTPQSFIIDCYGTEGKTMDLLVSILEEFKAALYDPQIPVRYDDFAM
jgi:ribose 5-phosphate isomerase